MKSYNRQETARYEESPTPKGTIPAVTASLVSALAPLHSVADAQLVMNVALPTTALNAVEQVVAVLSGAAPGISEVPPTRNLQDEAEAALQAAIDELDKSDPFAPFVSEGADFPLVCYRTWKEQTANLIARHREIEEQLKAEGDPE